MGEGLMDGWMKEKNGEGEMSKGEEGEKKKNEGKEEEAKKKEEEVKKGEEEKVVLKVDMHCEACARKVVRALKGFQGVEEVRADYKASRVVVKGKGADPLKLSQRIQKKSGRKVDIISPLPKPPEPHTEQPETKQEPPKQDKKEEEPPPVITVVLKVQMHCEACAQVVQKRIGKVKGVESVTVDIANNEVTVRGHVDPDKLVSDVYKRTRKHAAVVKSNAEKKEEKKECEKPEDEKRGEAESKEEDEAKSGIKKAEYWPPRNYMEHAYASQIFSDENPNACSVM